MAGWSDRGGLAELAIATAAAECGVGVLRPMLEGGRYDLVFDIGVGMRRIQCKSGALQADTIVTRQRTSRQTSRGPVVTTYSAQEIDDIAIYCHELKRSFLVPIEEVEGATVVHLRLQPARNNQQIGVRMADDYDLANMLRVPGAIAQLGERRAGSAKVVGSSPTSSI